MRIHLLEHDPDDLSNTNMTRWAKSRGHAIAQTYVCDHESLPALNDFDWLMVMGGSAHAWEDERLSWLAPEKEFVAQAIEKGKIIMGICFGAQLLALALGGTVKANRNQEIGWHDVTLTAEGRNSFLFRNIPQCFTTFHWHSDHCALPPACNRLASSAATSVQAFTVAGKPIAALQFHPEYTREMVGFYARRQGHEWVSGPFVPGAETVLKQTENLSATYWLMAALLDNMEAEFSG